MPQRRSDLEPPVMTWGKAAPALIAAGMFDLIGIFFEFFWFFGPALAGLYCAVKVGDVVGVGGILAAGCAAGAAAGGVALAAFTTPFGIIMGIATAFIGFLTVGLWVVTTNARIFNANVAGSVWFVGGFGVSMTPLIGIIPAFSLVLWRLYHTQIRVEKAAHAKWKKEQGDAQLQERQQQALMQVQSAELAATDVY